MSDEITYELAKKLKDAGFPQEGEGGTHGKREIGAHGGLVEYEPVYFPTRPQLLKVLIGECEGIFEKTFSVEGKERPIFIARGKTVIEIGSTPEEALTKLWLASNDKQRE